jgi:Kef-type K+ transport system membrane component KefB
MAVVIIHFRYAPCGRFFRPLSCGRGSEQRSTDTPAPFRANTGRHQDETTNVGDIEFIQQIGIMIVASTAVILISRRLNIPSIVLFIVTGLLLGPILGIISIEPHSPDHHDEGALGVVTEVGIALLLFLVGLELSLEKIRDVGKVAVLAGLGQVIFTALVGFFIAWALQFTVIESLFIATALTFSSTVVVVKLLDQKKELTALYGRIAVGIFLVQDLVVIVALTFLSGLGALDVGDAGESAAEKIQLGVALWELGKAFAGMAAMLAVAMIASKYLLARPFEWAARMPETLLIWSLSWCFLFVVAADVMGLSREIGAFLAGISLAQLHCAHDLRRRVHPLMSFFIAIFFVSLGAQMELGDAKEHWVAGVILSLFVLIGNPLIFIIIIAKSGYSERTSFLTSVTVAQISEFSFIFAAMGLATGLIDRSILSLIAVVGLVTIAASAYMILYNHQLYNIVRKLGLLKVFKASQEDDDDRAEPMRDHIIVVGMNSLGRSIVKQLHEKGETVLAIDTDARKLRGLPCRTMLGNIEYESVMEDAALANAKLAISALQIEDTNNLFAWHCKEFGVPVAIHAFDRSVVPMLRELGVDFVIDSKALGGVRAATIVEEQGVGGE